MHCLCDSTIKNAIDIEDRQQMTEATRQKTKEIEKKDQAIFMIYCSPPKYQEKLHTIQQTQLPTSLLQLSLINIFCSLFCVFHMSFNN